MFQIRFHGRGGQGVVTSAELAAIAAFKDGKEAQAFPFFGVERTGAPIEAYARIDDKPIRTREQVQNPDVLVILDATLIGTVPLNKGASEKTAVVVNTSKSSAEIAPALGLAAEQIHTVDATKIALEIFGKNLANTVILGAFAKTTGLVTIEGLRSAIKEKFEDKGKDLIEKNIKAIERAYEN